jgi:hypothetical protein
MERCRNAMDGKKRPRIFFDLRGGRSCDFLSPAALGLLTGGEGRNAGRLPTDDNKARRKIGNKDVAISRAFDYSQRRMFAVAASETMRTTLIDKRRKRLKLSG